MSIVSQKISLSDAPPAVPFSLAKTIDKLKKNPANVQIEYLLLVLREAERQSRSLRFEVALLNQELAQERQRQIHNVFGVHWVAVESRYGVKIGRSVTAKTSDDGAGSLCAIRAQYQCSIEAEYIEEVLLDIVNWGDWDFAIDSITMGTAAERSARVVYGSSSDRIPSRSYSLKLSHSVHKNIRVVTISPGDTKSESTGGARLSWLRRVVDDPPQSVSPRRRHLPVDGNQAIQGKIWHGQWKLIESNAATRIEFELQFDPCGADVSGDDRVLDLIAMQHGMNLLKVEKMAMQRKLGARLQAKTQSKTEQHWRSSEMPLSSSSTQATRTRRKSISDARTRFEYKRTIDSTASFSKEV